jgi:D-glycero-alpha-D-manno-heptose-7-phosphate kinase
LAGGIGSRAKLKSPKQYYIHDGLSILEHLVSRVADFFDQIIIVNRDSTFEFIHEYADITFVPSGKTRLDSIQNGIRAVAELNDSIVMIHEAARPLGGSSAFAVGLVKALHAFTGKNASVDTCARMACEVEIDRLGEPIGKQDQYAAAFGGLNFIEFKPDGSVAVEPIILTRERRSFLEERLVMFYTGQTRSASKILSEQKANTTSDRDKFAALVKMRAMADELRELLSSGDVEQMGDFLHRGWLLKRQLASGVSSSAIDRMYEAGLEAGAEGGKVLGAGGGGFLLFYCAPARQDALRNAMAGHREIRPKFDGQGTRVIYVDD